MMPYKHQVYTGNPQPYALTFNALQNTCLKISNSDGGNILVCKQPITMKAGDNYVRR